MRKSFAWVGAVAVVALAGAGAQVASAQAASSPAYYTQKVKPLFEAKCGQCHMGDQHKGGLSLQTKESTMKGGRSGVAVVPGDPANSLLVKLIRHEGPADDPRPMPPKEPKMSDADIAVVEGWVKAGAVMPPDGPPAQ